MHNRQSSCHGHLEELLDARGIVYGHQRRTCVLLQFLIIALICFQEHFTELKIIFSLSRCVLTNMEWFREFIGNWEIKNCNFLKIENS